MLTLHAINGDSYQISSGDTIGRSTKCDHRFDLLNVSRKHCQFICNNFNEWWVIDLNSKNGTLVDDIPVVHHPLHNGDKLQIASLTFQVAID